jgi:large subunit ribosomal protein L23
VKDPYSIIVRPHITEKSVALSYGSDRIKDEAELVRKYTFIVATDANKIEIKQAIEAIYNKAVTVTSVRTVKVLGKSRRRGQSRGYEPDRKKAIVTLAKGQMLEDYGV